MLRGEGEHILTFNTWGDSPETPHQLYYMTSPDLFRWSAVKPLAQELTEGQRAIDAAVTFDESVCC